jgi:hypothetical protein
MKLHVARQPPARTPEIQVLSSGLRVRADSFEQPRSLSAMSSHDGLTFNWRRSSS